MADPRKVTNMFLDRVEEGMYDLEKVVRSFCVWLSEDEIKEFVKDEEYLTNEEVNQ